VNFSSGAQAIGSLGFGSVEVPHSTGEVLTLTPISEDPSMILSLESGFFEVWGLGGRALCRMWVRNSLDSSTHPLNQKFGGRVDLLSINVHPPAVHTLLTSTIERSIGSFLGLSTIS